MIISIIGFSFSSYFVLDIGLQFTDFTQDLQLRLLMMSNLKADLKFLDLSQLYFSINFVTVINFKPRQFI
jgi:hypothetical protein